MGKITYKDGVKVETIGSTHPIIFIGSGPYSFKIKDGNETRIYLFETENALEGFAENMKKMYPDRKITGN